VTRRERLILGSPVRGEGALAGLRRGPLECAASLPSTEAPQAKSAGRFLIRLRARFATASAEVAQAGAFLYTCQALRPDRRTQYSPFAARHPVIPPAAAVHSFRHSRRRASGGIPRFRTARISSCNPRIMSEGSAIVSAFMSYMKAHLLRCAIIYGRAYNSPAGMVSVTRCVPFRGQ